MIIPKRYIICCFAFIAYSLTSIFRANNTWSTDYMIIFEDEFIHNCSTNVYTYSGRNFTTSELHKLKNTAKKGYLIGTSCAVIAGALATRYGGSSAFGIGLLINAMSNLLTPLTLVGNKELFIINNFMHGFSHMLSVCALSDLWSRWSPAAERSRLVVLSQLGLLIEVFFHPILSNCIAEELHWTAIFYVTGIAGIIWALIWLYYVENDPDHNVNLSDHEKWILLERLKYVRPERSKLTESPWKKILSSAPVWALSISAIFLNHHIIFTYMQLYLIRERLVDEKIYKNIIEWMAYSNLAFMLLAGWLADFLKNNLQLKNTEIRKGYICSAYSLASLLLGVFWFSPTLITFVIFFSIYELCRSISEVAISVNIIEISPEYSSFLSGLHQTLMIVALLVHQDFIKETIENKELIGYEFCFVVYFLLYIASALFYHLWGSAEHQEWRYSKQSKGDEMELS